MKRYTKVLILSACMALSLAFAGCMTYGAVSSGSQQASGQPSKSQPQAAYKVQFIRAAVDSMDLKDSPRAQSITSAEELKLYADSMAGSDDFASALAKYDDTYFQSNVLLVVASIEESGSITYEIDRIESSESVLTVFIDRHIPQVQTDDIAHWQTLVELSRADYADATAVEVQFNNQGQQ